MFSYSTGYYVSPPDDQYLKFKNRCSLLLIFTVLNPIIVVNLFFSYTKLMLVQSTYKILLGGLLCGVL
jgi:hypothetical protein